MSVLFGVLCLLCLLCLELCLAASVAPLRVKGTVAAVYTPFTTTQSLNLTAVRDQNAYLAATGVRYVFVGGTTGESLSLTTEERKSLLEAWVSAAQPTGTRVIAHVGSESLISAQLLASHACSLSGVSAFAAMPPTFFKPASVDLLAQFMKGVASACPSLPFYYYHIPSMTGVAFPMFDFIQAIERVGVPNFCGVKYTGLYTNPGFMDLQKCLAYQNGKYEILSGRDEMMLEALVLGVTGFVGSQYNFANDLYTKISNAYSMNNFTTARTQQLNAIELIDVWSSVPTGVNGHKLLMQFVVPGVGPSRLPYAEATTETVGQLREKLLGWCEEVSDVFLCRHIN